MCTNGERQRSGVFRRGACPMNTKKTWMRRSANNPDQGQILLAKVAGLALLRVISAFGWRMAYGPDDALGLVIGLQESKSPSKELEGVRAEIQRIQQQVVAQTQSQTQLMAVQQSELKRLSSEIAALSAKIDGFKQPSPPIPVNPVSPAAQK